MKLKLQLQLAVLTNCLFAVVHSASAQGTAFTYQGQLNDSGNYNTGNYDFTFALYNNNGTNSGKVGATKTNLNVGVTNGYIATTVDFGAVFSGTNYWLSI